MAYMSQDKKKDIVAKLKPILKGTGIKYSVGVRHHSTLVLNIKSGPVDFLQNYRDTIMKTAKYMTMPHMIELPKTYMDVNPYHYQDQFTGSVLTLLKKIFAILNDGNWDKSDIQTDYFNVGWYVDVNVGKWDKPYMLTK